MIAKNLQDMFRAEKTDKCCVCAMPTPHCEYEAEGICVFPFDPDDRPTICSRCPLGMCHMCRISRRIEARTQSSQNHVPCLWPTPDRLDGCRLRWRLCSSSHPTAQEKGLVEKT
jgi:hypothetical protein